VRVKEVKIKAIRLKRAKAGAQLEPEKAFSMLRLGALILFRIFVALKLANRWRVRGRRNQGTYSRDIFLSVHVSYGTPTLSRRNWFLVSKR